MVARSGTSKPRREGNGGTLSFVPFTRLEGGSIKGSHNGP